MEESQLARALYQGLGRPHVQARRQGRLDHPEVVLQACRTNPAYDRLCSGTRTAYLQELIDLSGQQRWFRDQILAALAEPAEEMDEPQLREFAITYARAGDAEARYVLYERVAEDAAAGDASSVCDVIDLDGPPALLRVADRLGELALSRPEDLADDVLLDYIEREHGAEALAALLDAARARGPFAAAYVDHALAARERGRVARDSRPQIAGPRYSDLRAYLAQGSDRVSIIQINRWAQGADDEDLRLAAEALLATEEPRRLLAHLQIFAKRRFPLSLHLLTPYAWHPNERVARRSLAAMEGLADADLRRLSGDLIAAGRYVDCALGLFVANYQPGDETLFSRLLDQAADDDAAHGVVFSLNDIYAANPTPAAADLLRTMYERGPCAICRADTVAPLLKLGALPDWMRAECRYDANTSTRDLVA